MWEKQHKTEGGTASSTPSHMSQQVLRPLRQWPWFHHHHHHHRTCVTLSLHHLLTPPPKTSHRFSFATVAASSRPKVRTPKSPVPPPPTADSDLEEKKSRNQLKREARRTVKWGMDLASFSPPQIKRILRSTSFPFPIYPFAFPQSPLSKVLSFPRHSTTSSPFFWVAGLLPRTIFFSSKLLCWLRSFFPLLFMMKVVPSEYFIYLFVLCKCDGG